MKKIAFLSFVAALGGILFGYDTAVISGTIAAVGEQFRLDAMAKGWYVGYALVGSIAGVAVAGFALWVGTYLIGQFTPWCMATLGSSGTFYFFAAMCVPYMLIMWRLVPETTGKSLEEIEAYWK